MRKIDKRIADMFISLIVPVQEDEKIIESFIKNLDKNLKRKYAHYEIILVDNGSQDQTIAILENVLTKIAGIRVLRLAKRVSLEAATYAGLENSIGDYNIVIIPHSDPPELISEIVEKMRAGSDVLYGYTRNLHNISPFAKFGRSLFYWYIKHVMGIDMSPNFSNYMGISRRAVNALTKVKSYYRNIKFQSKQSGFKSGVFYYNSRGQKVYGNLFDEVLRAFDIIFSYSRHPMRFVSLMGIFASILNLTYVFYILGIFLFKSHVAEGWTTFSLQTSTMFFFVFLILTVLAEYMGRTLEETREYPTFNVIDEITSKVSLINKNKRNVTR